MIETKSPVPDSQPPVCVRRCRMRPGISIAVTASDKTRREAIVAARGSRQKHSWRARIILTDQGLWTLAIMATTRKSKPRVWRCNSASWLRAWMACCTIRPGLLALRHSKRRWSTRVALTLEPSSRCNSRYGATSDHPSVLTSVGYGLRQMLIQYWMNQAGLQVHNNL